MNGLTHQAGGIAALSLLTLIPGAITPDTLLIALIAASLGSLLPDLDSRRSRLRELTLAGIRPFVIPSDHLNKTGGHRGFMHSYLGMVCVALATAPGSYYLGPTAWVALVAGYLSHLALDCCTVQGLRLLYPIRVSYHLLPKWARVNTGKENWLEEPVFVLLVCFDLVFLVHVLVRFWT